MNASFHFCCVFFSSVSFFLYSFCVFLSTSSFYASLCTLSLRFFLFVLSLSHHVTSLVNFNVLRKLKKKIFYLVLKEEDKRKRERGEKAMFEKREHLVTTHSKTEAKSLKFSHVQRHFESEMKRICWVCVCGSVSPENSWNASEFYHHCSVSHQDPSLCSFSLCILFLLFGMNRQTARQNYVNVSSINGVFIVFVSNIRCVISLTLIRFIYYSFFSVVRNKNGISLVMHRIGSTDRNIFAKTFQLFSRRQRVRYSFSFFGPFYFLCECFFYFLSQQ